MGEETGEDKRIGEETVELTVGKDEDSSAPSEASGSSGANLLSGISLLISTVQSYIFMKA
jgi:hypothetical protein